MAGNPKEVVALTNRLNDLGQQVSSAGSASIEVRNEIISNAKDLILSLLGVEDYVIQKSNNVNHQRRSPRNACVAHF